MKPTVDKGVTLDTSAITDADYEGLNIAIVGGTGGLGRATAHFLADRGAHVIVVGRTFRDQDKKNIQFMKADLSLMREAKRVAAELPAEKIDVLLLTTGIMAARERQESKEGIELDMAVSYLSRLVIVREIAKRLGKDNRPVHKPRIFVWGFPGVNQKGYIEDMNSEQSYSNMKVHMNTVAGNEMLVLDSAERYPHLGVYGMNPGFVSTNIRSNLFSKKSGGWKLMEKAMGLFTPTAESYAEGVAPLLVTSELENLSGRSFDSKRHILVGSKGLDDTYIKMFIRASEELVNKKLGK